ncbi:hypothetical protein NPIL_398401 [Nephila pilipes]|uniref:Uncharacterized protein n=1 Tax=Nephila pilipes TaxID=299642 RepID=A0A8X6Q7A9_NEPPI|nr:hypothetical protein NPIL_398401 [Nephila pilipes]
MTTKKLCHNYILPGGGNNLVKLFRYKRNIYKFTINCNEVICKSVRDFGEIETQRELEYVIFHILNLSQMKYGESTLCTSSFRIKISICPWQLCDKICFRAINNTFYFAGKQQVLLTFLEKTKNEDIQSPNSESSKCIFDMRILSDIQKQKTEKQECKMLPTSCFGVDQHAGNFDTNL